MVCLLLSRQFTQNVKPHFSVGARGGEVELPYQVTSSIKADSQKN